MPDLVVRPLDRADVERLLDWAAAEGWNPGLHDAPAFHTADPEDFLGLFRGKTMLSAIAAVAYSDSFGFIGLYICRPKERGKGFGRRVWDAGLGRLAGRTIGLDGVVAQQANYAREGFALAHRNVRYAGTVPQMNPSDAPLIEVRPETPSALVSAIVEYDRKFFPAPRDAFVAKWIRGPGRRAVAFVDDGKVKGYGVIRPCRIGYKVGPLFADDPIIADAIFAALVAPHEGAPVALDIPEPNDDARKLAERHGFAPAFETARMYRGRAPSLPLDRIFGITTFELG